jgi:hypothetical protein
MTDKNHTVRIDGQEIPDGPSETGGFGLSKDEFRYLILNHLANHRGKAMKQRALFEMICKHLNLEATGQKGDEMLRFFVQFLRELRDAGRVKFSQAGTAVYVKLV